MWATETYTGGTKTVQVGGRKAVLNHVYNAHTDGDTWVGASGLGAKFLRLFFCGAGGGFWPIAEMAVARVGGRLSG